MSGKFKAIIKIMQNQIQVKNSFSWKPASKFIQFAFEEGGLRPFGREEDQEQNLENGSPRKISKPQEQEEEEQENSYQPSNQVIDFEKSGRNNQSIQIQVSGHQVVDEISHTCVFVSKASIPTLSITFSETSKTETEQQGIPEKSKYIELFLAQKSHSCEYEKYKIIKGAIRGTTKEKIKVDSALKLEKIKFNYLSNPQKLPRLILVLYQQNQKGRIYKSIMISDEFTVIDNHKALFIQGTDQLRLYFEPIQTHFLDKSGTVVGKVNTLNKHKILEEMSALENYLIKKNKKIWNIVYAAYKYSHIIDLYFLSAEGKTKKDQFLELWKEVIEGLRAGELGEGEKTCNHLDPSARFILKINAQMRYVRFLVNKQVTKYLSIIATDAQFDNSAGKWTKFDTINDMKDTYILCQSQIQAKIISEPIVTKTNVNLASSVQHPTSAPIDSQKKPSGHHSKNDDDDFNEDDVEDEDDDMQYEGESSQNYSVSNRKRGRKLGQKKVPDIKKQATLGHRQNKYVVRGGSRLTRNRDDTEDSNDKKANMAKKLKEKEAMSSRVPMPTPVIGAPPFRVLTPAQAGQYKDQQTQSIDGSKIIGMIPMMMGKKPQDHKSQVQGVPKGVVMLPPGANPQMMMMPGGVPGGMMSVIPMGNGMQAVMMPGPIDKNGSGQGGMGGMSALSAMGMGAIGGMGGMPGMASIPGMAGMAGMGGMGGMTGVPMGGMNGMMPFMMGGSGMPQGMMIPMMPQQGQGQGDKNKQTELDKQKQGEKKQQKKDHFPPQMPDFSKMGMIGQMPAGMGLMPAGQMGGGMQMPQFMQMGMPPNMNGMMMAGNGMPQGIMMNPMMATMKPPTQGKDDGSSKQQNPTSMPNAMMGGAMPFMMQVPPQMQGGDSTSQSQGGMQMGMMGQFPAMVQMPQQSQMGSGGSQTGGMPMGYTMMLSPEQHRSMTPTQLQQIQMQMQMMMKGGMPMMPMPKDPNDQSKK